MVVAESAGVLYAFPVVRGDPGAGDAYQLMLPAEANAPNNAEPPLQIESFETDCKTGEGVTVTDRTAFGDDPQLLFAVRKIVPPLFPALINILFEVELPDQVPGIVQVYDVVLGTAVTE